ncbi:MAG TPA: Rv2231c family pyridoxal phosphate-dependent protein CobC [Actinophytocola sp.]|uniref:Rv2231c family pyridoxal phosphate-dependent protein CobC n=1 Tax=Actinophytocola sp. TaxID=1872138 RepID=UPI002DDCD4E9|nr:Rv2231c family pyridoxal phosphate-dependent protein CobC [Actinophytocola sp.]HEV2779577.1 Rv2231c family pyridoxal phosphate-dependent protein CobC [Actinophytocola sp.]
MTHDVFDPLRHHGDVDAEPGLLDFAVNVRGQRPPQWLLDRLTVALDRIGRYPSARDDARARAMVADRHRRRPEEILVLAGASEGFALLPNLRPTLAAIVHPSFTEPEVVLRNARVAVRRVILEADDGYTLAPERVPAEADLVVVGNPTNPTSVLHPAATLRRLARPGRVLLVDEAFMDAVVGETESLADTTDVPGLIVLRSLTKTWSLPGLRAGYAIAEPALLARLAANRPQWPVGTLVLEAVTACSEPLAVAGAELAAMDLTAHRDRLAAALAAIPGVAVHLPASAPFLLLRVPNGERVRAGLRRRGIAVRRADTFPGLTGDHLRVAVKPDEQAAALVAALRAELTAGGGPDPLPPAGGRGRESTEVTP